MVAATGYYGNDHAGREIDQSGAFLRCIQRTGERFFQKRTQRRRRRPCLLGEHSHAVGGSIKGLHGGGVRARGYVTADPAFLGVHREQAMLLLNVPDLKHAQVNHNGGIGGA